MAKTSGTTKGGSKGNPKGLTEGAKIGIWTFGTDSFNSPAVRAKGKEAEELYSATQTPVERAVERSLGHAIGQGIRTGGGFTGPANDREYTLIFADNTTKADIQKYLKGMKEGARLYAKVNQASKANVPQEEYDKVYDKYKKWLQSKGY